MAEYCGMQHVQHVYGMDVVITIWAAFIWHSLCMLEVSRTGCQACAAETVPLECFSSCQCCCAEADIRQNSSAMMKSIQKALPLLHIPGSTTQ